MQLSMMKHGEHPRKRNLPIPLIQIGQCNKTLLLDIHNHSFPLEESQEAREFSGALLDLTLLRMPKRTSNSKFPWVLRTWRSNRVAASCGRSVASC